MNFPTMLKYSGESRKLKEKKRGRDPGLVGDGSSGGYRNERQIWAEAERASVGGQWVARRLVEVVATGENQGRW